MLANETLYSLKEYPQESAITDVSDTFVAQNQEKMEDLPISDQLLAVQNFVPTSLESLIKQTPPIDRDNGQQTPCLGFRMLPTSLCKSTPI